MNRVGKVKAGGCWTVANGTKCRLKGNLDMKIKKHGICINKSVKSESSALAKRLEDNLIRIEKMAVMSRESAIHLHMSKCPYCAMIEKMAKLR